LQDVRKNKIRTSTPLPLRNQYMLIGTRVGIECRIRNRTKIKMESTPCTDSGEDHVSRINDNEGSTLSGARESTTRGNQKIKFKFKTVPQKLYAYF